jgi:hypothetical protein
MAMLRGNLATRPFYNERLVSLGIILGIVAVLALTAFNVSEIRSLTERRGAFKAEQDKDDGEAATIVTATQAVQRSVDQVRLAALARQTREANDLIDQRTFSWTLFLGHVEQTLPMDARLLSVSPRVERGVFQVTMGVNARRFDDVEDFIDQLLATGVFYDIIPDRNQKNDDGTFTSQIVTRYYLAPKPATAKPAGRGR